jgi:hypothetical protein
MASESWLGGIERVPAPLGTSSLTIHDNLTHSEQSCDLITINFLRSILTPIAVPSTESAAGASRLLSTAGSIDRLIPAMAHIATLWE